MRKIYFSKMKTVLLGAAFIVGSLLSAQVYQISEGLINPFGVSNTGVVALSDNGGNYIWTADGGLVAISTISNGYQNAGRPSISADGTKISGTITDPDNLYNGIGLYDVPSGTWSYLGGIGATSDGSTASAWGMTPDASMIVGLGWVNAGSAHAVKWTEAGGVVDMGSTVEGNSSRANAVNNDGTVIVGWQDATDGFRQAAVWNNDVQTLITDSDNNPISEAGSVSGNGEWVVGGGFMFKAWRWSEASGVQAIDHPSAGVFYRGSSTLVNNDGSMVLGYYTGWPGPAYFGEAFIWTEETGRISLNDYVDGLGIDRNGLSFSFPASMSADGKYIAGTALNTNNQIVAFLLQLPDEPEPGDACFEEDFADITNGNSTSTNGSGSQWSGNDNFPTVERAYQAGGAVKLGTGSAIGFIESRDLNEVEGDITVNIMVKGWTTIEGELKVSIDGQEQNIAYTAVMADDFELVTLNFTGITAGSNLKIETTAKRAFIDDVEIVCADAPEPEPQECSQDFMIPDAPLSDNVAYPNGKSVLASAGYSVANDILLPAYSIFTPETITIGMVLFGGEPTNLTFQVYSDNGSGGVGASYGPSFTLTPADYTATLEGSWNGLYPAYKITVDVSVANIVLENNTDTDTYYWLGIQGDASTTGDNLFWLVSNYISGSSTNPTWFNDGTGWAVSDAGIYEGAYKVEGLCTEIDLEDCAGTPDAGTLSGPDSICPSISFALQAEGVTSGVGGLTKQWQSSPAGQDDWSDIAGATSNTYNVIGGITAATDYRFVITCTHSGESDMTEVHSVALNGAEECYCTPVFSTGCTSGDYIDNFVLNGENGTSINDIGTGCSAGAYDDRTDESVDLYGGMDYMANMTVGFSGQTAVIWIDFNDSGTFEASEKVGSMTGIESSGADIPMIIPGGVALGEHRMRVMTSWAGDPNTMDPCDGGTWGEAHDYTVNIVVKPDCEGTPNGGTISVTPEIGNPGSTYVVSSTGYTNAENMTYQWQSNTDDAGWVNEGAATDSYADYTATAPTTLGSEVAWRLEVTCTGSGETAHSDIGTFTVDIVFCDPTITFAVEPISRVNISDIDNPSDANGTLPYEDFTSIQGHMAPGVTYDGAFEGNTAGNYTTYFTVFIDWNQNGVLNDAGEVYEIGSITNSTGTDGQQAIGTVTVPDSAISGITRMRVIKNYFSSPIDPCGEYGYGQIEDYSILVGELEDCEGTPEGGTVTVSPEQGNPGSAYVVKSTGYTLANGLTYQWQSNTDDAGWVDEGEATTSYANYNAVAPLVAGVAVDWRLVVTCTNSGESGTSTTDTFTTVEPGCGWETVSNALQNGFGYMEQAERANDFVIPVNTRFYINQVKVNMFITAGTTVEGADINFYEDSGNGPGAFVSGEVFAIPSSMDYVGSNFGIDVYTLTFDIDQVLDGNTTTETTYWMSMLLYANGNTFWEVTYNMDSPNEFYSNDGTGNWIPGSDPTYYGQVADGVMEINGECATLDAGSMHMFDFAYYPNPVRDVLNITSKSGLQSVTAYNLAGQEVLNLNGDKLNSGQIDVTTLPKGAYVFRAVLEGGQVETFKIVKK